MHATWVLAGLLGLGAVVYGLAGVAHDRGAQRLEDDR